MTIQILVFLLHQVTSNCSLFEHLSNISNICWIDIIFAMQEECVGTILVIDAVLVISNIYSYI